MKRAKKRHISTNAYMPKAELMNYLINRLQHEKLYKKKKLAGEDLSEEEQRERDNDIRMKVHILNKYVFQSMANIIFFLEHCMYSPFQEIFNDDIEELLLGVHHDNDIEHSLYHHDYKLGDKEQRDSNYENRTVIARFLVAILSWNSRKYPENFRLKLFPIIQRAVTSTILRIARETLGNRMLESVVINDFARAGALAEFIGKGIRIKTDIPNRPVKF